MTLYARQQKRHRCKEQSFGLWEKARVGWSERTALKHVYYQLGNRSPVHVWCMRQEALGAGALGWPRGMGCGGRWEGGSGWGTHINSWLIHVNVWQKPLQYCKVIILQRIKIKGKKLMLKWPYYSRQSTDSLHSYQNANGTFHSVPVPTSLRVASST